MNEIADKQIIINGLDVSKCDFYDKNKKYCLTLKMNTTGFKNPSCFSGDFQECIQDSKVCPNTFCDNNHNCYYKQLQQLKAENEELKNKLKTQKNKRIIVECGKRSIKNILHKYTLFQQCLDECLSLIEKEVNPYDTLLIIKNNIKEVLNYE